LRDPERIRAGIDRLIEEERTEAGRDPERDAEFWSKKITEVEVERRGYHRLAVKGHMTDEELAAALSELDEARETAEREQGVARAKGEALQRLEHDRDAPMESCAGMLSETSEDLAPEERHRIYKLLRLGVHFRPDWPPEDNGRLRGGGGGSRGGFVFLQTFAGKLFRRRTPGPQVQCPADRGRR
jgi:hypothetical protein